jgi:hypothetical protein
MAIGRVSVRGCPVVVEEVIPEPRGIPMHERARANSRRTRQDCPGVAYYSGHSDWMSRGIPTRPQTNVLPCQRRAKAVGRPYGAQDWRRNFLRYVDHPRRASGDARWESPLSNSKVSRISALGAKHRVRYVSRKARHAELPAQTCQRKIWRETCIHGCLGCWSPRPPITGQTVLRE